MNYDRIIEELRMLNLEVKVEKTHVHLGSDPMPVHYDLLANLFAVLAKG